MEACSLFVQPVGFPGQHCSSTRSAPSTYDQSHLLAHRTLSQSFDEQCGSLGQCLSPPERGMMFFHGFPTNVTFLRTLSRKVGCVWLCCFFPNGSTLWSDDFRCSEVIVHICSITGCPMALDTIPYSWCAVLCGVARRRQPTNMSG